MSIFGIHHWHRTVDHGCADNTDLTVSSWGSNPNGELGNGTTTDSISTTLVINLGDVDDLAVGAHHACVLLDGGGEAKCWGRIHLGSLVIIQQPTAQRQ